MTTTNTTEVIVKGNDRITGSEKFETTIDGLKSWELSEDDINEIMQGGTVKCVSPNGRRIIWITKK